MMVVSGGSGLQIWCSEFSFRPHYHREGKPFHHDDTAVEC